MGFFSLFFRKQIWSNKLQAFSFPVSFIPWQFSHLSVIGIPKSYRDIKLSFEKIATIPITGDRKPRYRSARRRRGSGAISIRRIHALVVLWLLMPQKYHFASIWSISGRSHIGSLFVNGEQKRMVSDVVCSTPHMPDMFMSSDLVKMATPSASFSSLLNVDF